MENSFNELCSLFENGIRNDEDRELLGNSLFYYCCGKDPSPIIAFGPSYPLYVYVDLIEYGHGCFETETNILYPRIQDTGYQLIGSQKLESTGPLQDVENAVLTSWTSACPESSGSSKDSEKKFHVLYVQSDAYQAYRKIYHDIDEGSHDNYILPRCICNYRYEFHNHYSEDGLLKLSKRTEFVMGHCHSDKYKQVAEYDYFGDYGFGGKIELYRRKYWYLH